MAQHLSGLNRLEMYYFTSRVQVVRCFGKPQLREKAYFDKSQKKWGRQNSLPISGNHDC